MGWLEKQPLKPVDQSPYSRLRFIDDCDRKWWKVEVFSWETNSFDPSILFRPEMSSHKTFSSSLRRWGPYLPPSNCHPNHCRMYNFALCFTHLLWIGQNRLKSYRFAADSLSCSALPRTQIKYAHQSEVYFPLAFQLRMFSFLSFFQCNFGKFSHL